jgi:hypothetical protein
MGMRQILRRVDDGRVGDPADDRDQSCLQRDIAEPPRLA